MYSSDTICELLYKLRDSVNSGKLEYALMLSREVHDLISHLIYSKQPMGCILDCGRKIDETKTST